ncbi:MAG: DUF3450 family protein [Methylococcales bacterium]|nr:DUF3450 family protein [Methylococcales bacterium]
MCNKLARAALSVMCFWLALPVEADSLDNLAQSLIDIRSEVEELQSQLDMDKQSHRQRMETLGSQLTDLTIENQRQQVALEKMQQSLVKYRDARAQSDQSSESLVPVLLASIDDITGYVERSLPFKIEGRLAELSKLREKVETRALAPKKAANRLWALIEDEVRLSRENAVYTQTIELNGESLLVDVAKLGSVMLFFKTSDERYGKAVRHDGQWQFVELKQIETKEQVAALFDSLKKQIRQGYFELPNALEL